MNPARPILVAGLGLGDETKGSNVDLCARVFGPSLVTRYTGASQVGHNVVSPEGTWHCFAQFGAGSLVDTSGSALSRHMLVNLESLAVEADILQEKVSWNVWSRQTVDPDCPLITPWQIAVGRMREIARGGARHGSCGMGVGETVFDAEAGLSVRVRDILDGTGGARLVAVFRAKLAEAARIAADADDEQLRALAAHLEDRDPEALFYRYQRILGRLTVEPVPNLIRRAAADRTLIFEGAQGALLDRARGFVPHVTKTDTTVRNALDLLAEAGVDRAPLKLGILRAYGHRHGAGPFVAEDESQRARFADRYNPENRWQGAFRVGWLDLPALRYGARMNGGVDALSLACLDQLSGLDRVRVCVAYRTPDGHRIEDIPDDLPAADRTALVASCGPEWIELPGWSADVSAARRWGDLPANARAFIRFLEGPESLGTPVAILSVGPTAGNKLILRPDVFR